MPDYRVYFIGADGHVSGVPVVITCDDDETAIEQAKQMKEGKAIEVWFGARRIAEV